MMQSPVAAARAPKLRKTNQPRTGLHEQEPFQHKTSEKTRKMARVLLDTLGTLEVRELSRTSSWAVMAST